MWACVGQWRPDECPGTSSSRIEKRQATSVSQSCRRTGRCSSCSDEGRVTKAEGRSASFRAKTASTEGAPRFEAGGRMRSATSEVRGGRK